MNILQSPNPGSSLSIRMISMILITMAIYLTLPAVDLHSATEEIICDKRYLQRNLLRMVPTSRPTHFERYDRYSYSIELWGISYVVYRWDPYAAEYFFQCVCQTRAEAESWLSSGGKIEEFRNLIRRQTGLIGEDVSDRQAIPSTPGAMGPGEIDDQASDASGIADSGRGAIISAPAAANITHMETAAANDPAAQAAEDCAAAEAAARSAQDKDDREYFARRFGDPVKTSTGALSLDEIDLRIIMPSRAPDFALERRYDSSVEIAGFFGPGWSSPLESRIIIGESGFTADPAEFRRVAADLLAAAELLPGQMDDIRAHIRDSLARLEQQRRTCEESAGNWRKIARQAGTGRPALRDGAEALAEESGAVAAEIERNILDLEDRLRQLEEREQAALSATGELTSGLRKAALDAENQAAGDSAARDANAYVGYPGMPRPATGSASLILIPFTGGRRVFYDDGSGQRWTCEGRPLEEIIRHRAPDSDGGSEAGWLHRWGNGFSCSYDGYGRLTGWFLQDIALARFFPKPGGRGPERIELIGGRVIRIGWRDHRVVIMEDWNAARWEYRYTSGGRLSTVLRPDGSVREYEYRTERPGSGAGTAIARLAEYSGVPALLAGEPGYRRSYEYDADGRVIRARDSEGLDEGFSYQTGADGRIRGAEYVPAGDSESAYERNRDSTRMEYDSMGRMTRLDSPDRPARHWHYDAAGRIQWSRVDERDYEFQYDPSGAISRIIGPGGGTEAFEYDRAGRMTLHRDADGVETRYSYCPDGCLDSITHDDGSRMSFVYDALLRMTSRRDEAGNLWRYEYDRYGYLSRLIDPEANVTRYEYDSYGLLRAIIPAEGGRLEIGRDRSGTQPVSPAPDREDPPEGFQIEYSPAGRIRLIRDPADHTTRISRGERGLISRIDYPDGSSESFRYSPRGLLVSAIDRAGGISRYEYDRRGLLRRIIGPGGVATEYLRDGNGRITRISRGDSGSGSGFSAAAQHTDIEYDARGNTTQITDPEGGVQRWEYDDDSRPVRYIDERGEVTRYEYPEPGTKVSIDPMGGQTQTTRDPDGRIIERRDASGRRWTVTREELPGGLREIISMPSGARWVNEYDDQERLVRTLSPEGVVESREYREDTDGSTLIRRRGELVETVRFDTRGNPVARYSGNDEGSATRYRYDTMNQLISETRPGGYWKRYSWQGGRITSSEDSLGNRLLYAHTPAGQLLSIRDGRDGALLSRFEYDSFGRPVLGATPEVETRFIWDAAGPMTRSWDSASGISLTYAYSPRGELIRIEDSTGNREVRSYDPAGNLASLELFAGTPSRAGFRYDFRHDAAGRLTEAVSHRDRISRSWRYSQNGYPVSISARRGQEILQASLYHYDHDDRIRYSVDQSRTLSSFEYDSSGRIARLRRTAPEESDSFADPASPQAHMWSPPYAHRAALEQLWRDSGMPGRLNAYRRFILREYRYEPGNPAPITPGRLSPVLRTNQRGDVIEMRWPDQAAIDEWSGVGGEGYGYGSPSIPTGLNFTYDALGRLSEVQYVGGGTDRMVYDAFNRPVLKQSGDMVLATIYRGLLPEVHGSVWTEAAGMAGFDAWYADGGGSDVAPRRNPRYNDGQYRGPRFSGDKTRPRTSETVISGAMELAIAAAGVPLGSVRVHGHEIAVLHRFADRNLSNSGVFSVQTNESAVIGYEVYGSLFSITGTSDSSSQAIWNNARQHIGTDLYDFGYRFYSPAARRFLNADPMGTGFNAFSYCDNDPVNHIDRWGLTMTGYMNFNIEQERLHGFIYDDGDDTLDSVMAFDLYTTNNVRERAYPTKSGQANDTDAFLAIQANGQLAEEAIIPTNFPSGAFRVTAILEKNNKRFGEFFIATTANQSLPSFTFDDKDSEDSKDDEWVPLINGEGNRVYTDSFGYGFHAGGYSGDDPLKNNNPSDTTLGCGRLSTKDAGMLAGLLSRVLDDGGGIQGCAH
jgi:RHS repeat-associated protein